MCWWLRVVTLNGPMFICFILCKFLLLEKWFQVLKNEEKCGKGKLKENFIRRLYFVNWGRGGPVFAFSLMEHRVHPGVVSVAELMKGFRQREQGPHVLSKTLIEEICKYLIISSQLQNKDYVGLSFVGQSLRETALEIYFLIHEDFHKPPLEEGRALLY